MTARPRVIARYDREPLAQGRLCDDHVYATPGIELRLDFDLHDHDAALNLLEQAVEDVRGQIAETTTEDA